MTYKHAANGAVIKKKYMFLTNTIENKGSKEQQDKLDRYIIYQNKKLILTFCGGAYQKFGK